MLSIYDDRRPRVSGSALVAELLKEVAGRTRRHSPDVVDSAAGGAMKVRDAVVGMTPAGPPGVAADCCITLSLKYVNSNINVIVDC